jgi:hypothetical protein
MTFTLFAVLALAAPPEPLRVDTPSIDAGEVKAGPVLTRRFAFVNAGAEPLTVTDLKAGCGCATPTLAKRTYQPGERGELTLAVNTLSQAAGPQRWAVTVGYQCGGRSESATLRVTARLVRDVTVDPTAVVIRGCEPQRVPINIIDSRRPPLTITAVRPSSGRLKVWLTGQGWLAPGDDSAAVEKNQMRMFRVDVWMAPDCPEGTFSEAATIVTDDPAYSEITIPVTIVREPKGQVTAVPSRAALVAGGSAVVQLRDADGRPVAVEKAEPGHPALTCRWTAGPGNLATLRVGLDRGKWDGGDLTADVRVTANGQTTVIPVAVRAKE